MKVEHKFTKSIGPLVFCEACGCGMIGKSGDRMSVDDADCIANVDAAAVAAYINAEAEEKRRRWQTTEGKWRLPLWAWIPSCADGSPVVDRGVS